MYSSTTKTCLDLQLKNYNCSFISTDSEQCNAKATSPFKPTILVEMYTTFTLTADEETKITQVVHDTMQECLVQLKGLTPDSVM